jgi:hypothetical protein
MKHLLLTMLDPTTLSQKIAQVVRCDNYFFECHQKKRWEPSLVQKNFTTPMPPQLVLSTTNDNPMQIDETIFNPLIEQKK